MTDMIYRQEDGEPMREMRDFGSQLINYFNNVQQLMADYECLRQKVTALEAENRKLSAEKGKMEEAVEQLKKGDEWSSRVTYENVVEQIASNEDAAQRDQARKVFEPLLKKSQVTQLRRDVKRRVKELNEEGGVAGIENDFRVRVAGNLQIGNADQVNAIMGNNASIQK